MCIYYGTSYKNRSYEYYNYSFVALLGKGQRLALMRKSCATIAQWSIFYHRVYSMKLYTSLDYSMNYLTQFTNGQYEMFFGTWKNYTLMLIWRSSISCQILQVFSAFYGFPRLHSKTSKIAAKINIFSRNNKKSFLSSQDN